MKIKCAFEIIKTHFSYMIARAIAYTVANVTPCG